MKVTRDLGRNNVLFGTQLAAIKVQTTLDLSFLNGKQTMNNIQTLTAEIGSNSDSLGELSFAEV